MYFQDVQRLGEGLPNLVRNYKIPGEKFNHADVVLGIDASKLIFKPIIEFMNTYRDLKGRVSAVGPTDMKKSAVPDRKKPHRSLLGIDLLGREW